MPSKRRHPSLDILIHCPGSHGVVADQAHKQATALHNLGIKVLVLCSLNYLRTRNAAYPTLVCMAEGATTQSTSLISRKLAKAGQTIHNQLRFSWEVFSKRPTLVLAANHVDSQSPLWVWPHILMVLFRKTIYALNLHFSNRDHHLGPKWWQRVSAKLAFKPFRIGVAHKRLVPSSLVPPFIRQVEVPLGPDSGENVYENPKAIRKKWNIPRGKKVFLAFGAVRNHKNLDLAIRALLDNPQACLVIQGSVGTHRDRPIKYYQMLAEDLGLSKRVIISDDFVPDNKRKSYFEAADFILLTYTASYHSQSGILAMAAKARRRVLASSGTSPMRDMIRQFGLGLFVEPDSSDAVANGMATLLHAELPEPDWEGFEDYATWETNVTRLLEAAADYVAGRSTPVRQFEGLEDEAFAEPEPLNARLMLEPPKAKTARKSPTKKDGTKKPRKTTSKASSKSLDEGTQAELPGLGVSAEEPAPGERKMNLDMSLNGDPASSESEIELDERFSQRATPAVAGRKPYSRRKKTAVESIS
jgi:glycosyltransferase involved in cell wall biosynthesis